MLPFAENGQHRCVDCRADISDLRRDALRCETCRVAQARERASRHYYQNRPQKLEYVKKRRQDPAVQQMERAWIARNRERLNQRQRDKHRAKVGYNPEVRTCEECHERMPATRGHRAKRCDACSTPTPRECIFCHTNISDRGDRAKFCGEEHRRLYHESKELQGYTKACTKCKESKEHTEFGFHNRLRRPVCKVCEVRSQTERLRKFTPEQLDRRLSLRREREEIKRANRTPEEKVQLRVKRRKAYLRKEYGTDFDEDRMHLGKV